MRRLLVLLAVCVMAASAQRMPLIFDTDMGNDVDDALALAMLHALESRGECRIIGVTVTKDNPWAAVYVDLLNTFYGRGEIPVGVVKGGVTPEASRMIQVPAERRAPDGRLVYPRRLSSGAEAPEAVGLLRRLLREEKDGSVVVVQVGFSTNLARLLDDPADVELVRRKVKLLSVMAGNFSATPRPEFNVEKDVASARKLFERWPGEMVVSGWEIGDAIKFPAAAIEKDFAWTANHPVVDAYRTYMKMPYDRPTWDLTAALYAVRPEYFGVSARGRITTNDKGVTKFEARADGKQRYLVLLDKARVLEAMVMLASQPKD